MIATRPLCRKEHPMSERIQEIRARCEAAQRHRAEHKAGNWESHYAKDMACVLDQPAAAAPDQLHARGT